MGFFMAFSLCRTSLLASKELFIEKEKARYKDVVNINLKISDGASIIASTELEMKPSIAMLTYAFHSRVLELR